MNEYQGYRIRPSKVCVYYCHLFVRFPASASEILGMTLDFGIGYFTIAWTSGRPTSSDPQPPTFERVCVCYCSAYTYTGVSK